MKTLLMGIGAIALLALSSIWYGYVLSITWGWYVAPTFNITRLSVPVAIGLATVIRMITWQDTKSANEEKPANERFLIATVRSFTLPAFLLFFCWIVKFWM